MENTFTNTKEILTEKVGDDQLYLLLILACDAGIAVVDKTPVCILWWDISFYQIFRLRLIRRFRAGWRQFRISHLLCVAHKTENAVRTITSNIIETGIWLKSTPNNPFVSFSTLRSFAGGVLPTEASKWHHAWRNSTKPLYSLICSWCGPCLARVGEIRCTADMQLYPLHRRSVSSSIRAARLGNFHGKSRGGKL